VRGRALLIDSDGVLVDSAASIRAAFIRWGGEYGLDGAQIHDRYHGRRSSEIAAAVLPASDVSRAAARLDACEIDAAAEVRACAGSADFLAQVSGRWTVVSSGPLDLIKARLKAAGLPAPAHYVSAESVRAGKPDPEGYLLASALNGAKAGECLAIEDSIPGLTAALAAGCITVQVGGAAHPAASLIAATVENLTSVRPSVGPEWISLYFGDKT
jgi:mannitol-1-/sugar-/sorbitol-6-phosphatase